MEQIAGAMAAAAKDITPQELRFTPQPGKWNAGEILEHLTLAYTSTILGLNRVLERGRGDYRRVSFDQRLKRMLVLGIGIFPPRRKAPEPVVPEGKDLEYALESASKSLPALDLLLSVCAERFGPDAPLLRHHILGPLSANQWRRFHHVHTLHHLKQIKKLREAAAVRA